MTTLYKVTKPNGEPFHGSGIVYEAGKTYRRRNTGTPVPAEFASSLMRAPVTARGVFRAIPASAMKSRMTRFWRAMPTAPAAAARPAAPTTVPKTRPLMLNARSLRSPRHGRRCRCGAGRTGRRCGSRSRS